MNNRYFLLRHGPTIYQTEKTGILYPASENASVPLVDTARELIAKNLQKIKGQNIDLVFSSPFLRTRQTAEIAVEELKIKAPIILDDRLVDLNLGKFHGRPKEEYQAIFSNRMEKFTKRPEGGENWTDLKTRLTHFLNVVESKNKGKNILIVSHGDPLWMLAGLVKGVQKQEDFFNEELYPAPGQLIVV